MSIKSSGVHDWPPVTSAHASLGKADATRSLAVRPVASIQSALLTARDPSSCFRGSSLFPTPWGSNQHTATHYTQVHSRAAVRGPWWGQILRRQTAYI